MRAVSMKNQGETDIPSIAPVTPANKEMRFIQFRFIFFTAIFFNRIWYVSAIYENIGELRTYNLNRIDSAVLLHDIYCRDTTLNPLKGMDENFGIYHEDKPFKVQISTDVRTADMLIEELIQYSRDYDEIGRVNIGFTTNQHHEVLYWLLKWGGYIEVLEPQEIRNELLEIGNKFVALYGLKKNESMHSPRKQIDEDLKNQ
ncbi:MAG: WYL domain-containing protein [Spirochaetales bacterium]|nr:WYL domain-containing protein [Spirochaetales bacterium]